MTTQPVQQMRQLASTLDAASSVMNTQLMEFDSGGAMLDVRSADGRLLVMAYGPTLGFGVDEVQDHDAFGTYFEFTSDDFNSAAHQLRTLIGNDDTRPTSPVGLNLIVIYSGNIEVSKTFYDRLGLQFQLEQHGAGPQHYAATLNGTIVEIYPCEKGRVSGGVRIGFQVPYVDQVVHELKDCGTRILSEPKQTPWGRRAVIEDPDGNCVEILESSKVPQVP